MAVNNSGHRITVVADINERGLFFLERETAGRTDFVRHWVEPTRSQSR